MYLIFLSRDNVGLWVTLNVVMNLAFHKMRVISSLAEELSASQEGL